MVDIAERINIAARDALNNNIDPNLILLGDEEMKELLEWFNLPGALGEEAVDKYKIMSMSALRVGKKNFCKAVQAVDLD